MWPWADDEVETRRVQPYEAKADEAAQAIIAGSVTVPDKL